MIRNLMILSLISLVLSFPNKAMPQNPTLTLSASLMGKQPIDTDAMVIYFLCGGTDNFNRLYDAYKLFNSSPVLPNLYVILPGIKNYLSIKALPPLTNCRIDTLGFSVDTTATYNITAIHKSNFPNGAKIILIDSLLHHKQDLDTNPVYGPFNFSRI